MVQITANGITIEAEAHGDPSHPAMILVMGLAGQLVTWPPAYVQGLVDAGYRVIIFDNRDIGLSEKLHAKRAPKPARMMVAKALGLGRIAPYTLEDMARDTLGVFDAFNVEKAHLVGVSMGGMIGQIFAATYPERVKSFSAIMTSTNNPRLPKADPAIIREVFTARTTARTRDDLINRSVGLWQLIGTKDGGHDPDAFRERITLSVDRCTYPAGIRRQIAAIIATGDLRRWTRKISAPSQIIHGKADPLVPCQAGLDVAANIKEATSTLIDGMGHDLPPAHQSEIIRLITDHAKSVDKNTASTKAA